MTANTDTGSNILTSQELLLRAVNMVPALKSRAAHTEELRRIPDEGEYVIEFYGRSPLASYLSVISQHEAIHHGQWSFYATLGGFETPPGWKLNWGL